jgi:hypothetical protein
VTPQRGVTVSEFDAFAESFVPEALVSAQNLFVARKAFQAFAARAHDLDTNNAPFLVRWFGLNDNPADFCFRVLLELIDDRIERVIQNNLR